MKVINACKPPPREMKKCSLSKCPSSAFLRNAFTIVQFTAWVKKSDAKKKKKIQFLRKKKNKTTHTLSAGFWFRLCPTLLHLPHTKAFYIYRILCSRATGSRAWTKSCNLRHGSTHLPRLRNRWLVATHTAVIIKIKMIFSSSRQRPNSY